MEIKMRTVIIILLVVVGVSFYVFRYNERLKKEQQEVEEAQRSIDQSNERIKRFNDSLDFVLDTTLIRLGETPLQRNARKAAREK